MKKKIFKWDNLIYLILIIAFILRIIAMIQLTPDYNITSDDLAFIDSGIAFKNTGEITMHGVESAKNMPGMTFIIALFAFIFGDMTTNFWIFIKLFWILMGIACIYGLYKIIKLYSNPIIASLLCLLFCIPDFVWLDNLILTETPYMLCNVFLMYSSLQLEKTKKNKYFCFIIIWYILALMIRPTIALFPLVLFVYLLLNKYDFKLMIKQGIIALSILLLILLPWWYRNYKLFNEFIPLTYGTGDPLLLGTYQGEGYPLDEDLNYNEYKEVESEEIKQYASQEEYTSKKQWAVFRDEENKAKFRMKKWWQFDKFSMIKSYLIIKPAGLIWGTFYWDELFGVSAKYILLERLIDIIICALCVLVSFFVRNRLKEILFIILSYVYQVALYSYTFSFDRYGQVLIFFRYVIIGWMIYEVFEYIKRRKVKKIDEKNSDTNTLL